MGRSIGTIGNINTLTLGGVLLTDLSTLLIRLISYADGGSRSTLRRHTGSSGYTPSGALKLRMHAVRVVGKNTAAQSGTGLISYGDTDLGMNVGTAITNPVYIGGSSTIMLGSAGVGVDISISTDFLVPNGKYINCGSEASTNTTCHVYGYEEA